MYRPSYIEVNGNTLEKNVKNLIENYPDYKYYFGVVKNNAYHHGIYSVKYLIKGGVNYLAVSSLEEAIAIRKYNRSIPILCLEPIESEYVFDAINNNVTLTISSCYDVEKLLSLKLTDEVKVHIKIDSGMNRLGFKEKNDLSKCYKKMCENSKILIEGIYTHFATSGVKDIYYNKQVEKFLEITSCIDIAKIPIVHLDRSLTLVLHDKLSFANGVRLGISMYGYSQKLSSGSLISRIRTSLLQKKYGIKNIHLNNNLNLDFALSVYSKVIEVRKASKDEIVGYGACYKFNGDSYVATVPVGYADGVIKDFKYVYINNKQYPIIAECMDMIMVLIDTSVKIGDIVEIAGKHQNLKQLGINSGLNGYKLLNLFSNRLPVEYKYNNDVIEIKY